MQISNDKKQKEHLQLAESVESREISSSSSEWNLGLDELFVTRLHSNSKTKIAKPIKIYLDLFINTRLNHMSIRYRHVSLPNNTLNSNSAQPINSTNLLPIIFGVIWSPKLRNKISTNSQISPENSKVHTIKILLYSGASASIVCKDVLYDEHERII